MLIAGEYSMNSNDAKLSELFQQGCLLIKNFRTDFKNPQKLQVFLEHLDIFFELIDDQTIIFEYDIFRNIQKSYMVKNAALPECDVITRRKRLAGFFLYNSPWKDKMEEDQGIWSDMDQFLTEGTMREYSKKNPMYYKNFMPEEAQNKYEQMLDLIRAELVSYSTKLMYCKKILHFFEEESTKEFSFPLSYCFLNTFFNTAISEMILVAMKLFSTTNTQKNENFGFYQLKDYIAKNCDGNANIHSSLDNTELKTNMNDGKKKCSKLKILRDALIAHYDISRVEEAKNTKVSIEDLEELYNLSTTILEKLSFFKFHRQDSAYAMMIETHGFKKAVCQTIFNNENMLQTDLDVYLDMLKNNFNKQNNT